MNRRPAFFIIFALSVSLFGLPAAALENPGKELTEVGVRPLLGAQVDTKAALRDENGNPTTLARLSGGALPVIIVPAYYHCPRLCGLVLGGVAKAVKEIDLALGRDYRIAAVSFDPSDSAESAKTRQTEVLSTVPAERKPAGASPSDYWPFLTGDAAVVDALMKQVGFTYRPDGADFAHSAAIFVLTPEGKISQYFTGIEFPSFDLRLALVEASRGEVGSMLDHVLLFCFRFDPTKGKYVWAAFNTMRIGGAATLLLLVSLIYILWRREKAATSRYSR